MVIFPLGSLSVTLHCRHPEPQFENGSFLWTDGGGGFACWKVGKVSPNFYSFYEAFWRNLCSVYPHPPPLHPRSQRGPTLPMAD